MSSPTLPAQPAPPDFASANREAIQTDISTLPLRRQIDQAARLGQTVTYTDPTTGQQRTADFAGMGDGALAQQMAELLGRSNADLQRQQLSLREELGTRNAQQTAAELRAADPRGYDLRQDVMESARQGLALGGSNPAPSANIASAENRLWTMAGAAPQADGRVAGLYDEAGARLGGGRFGELAGETNRALGSDRLGSIYDEATRLPGTVSDSSSTALNEGLQRALEEFRLGGKMTEADKRDLTNDVRAAQIAKGNYLGDAATVVEATEMGKAGDARKAARLASLLDIQGRAFGQNTQLRNESAANARNRISTLAGLEGQRYGQEQGRLGMVAGLEGQRLGAEGQRIGTQAQLAGQDFGQRQQSYTTGLNAAQAAFAGTQAMANDQRAARMEGFNYDQQRFANAQSAGLGAPITNQFAGLGGAQQGAVGFTPVNFTPGQTTNPNAGAQGASFAQGNFGTQAGMWGTSANIAAQGNPWMSLVGNVLGAGAGAATGRMFGG